MWLTDQTGVRCWVQPESILAMRTTASGGTSLHLAGVRAQFIVMEPIETVEEMLWKHRERSL